MAKTVKLKLEQVRELVRKRKIDVLSKIFYCITICGKEWKLQGRIDEVNLDKRSLKKFHRDSHRISNWLQYEKDNLDISLF